MFHSAAQAFTYDLNGNLTGDGTSIYGYDVENRLTSRSSGIALAYAPNGRVWQTSGGASGTTRYLYDGDSLVAEYNGSGTMLARYVFGPGVDEPVIADGGSSMNCTQTQFLHPDSQGSVIATANCGGNPLSINVYDEYGIPGALNAGRFQYTGQIWLPDLGMYYYKARVYSPNLGRFLQVDPIGYKDQVNLYAYVGNDPINKTDPSGECAPFCTAAVGALVGGVVSGVGYLATSSNPTFAGTVANAASGALTGAAIGSGAGIVAVGLIGGAANATSNVFAAASEGNLGRYGTSGGDAAKQIAVDAVVGAAGAVVGKTTANVVAAGASAVAKAVVGPAASGAANGLAKGIVQRGTEAVMSAAQNKLTPTVSPTSSLSTGAEKHDN